MYAIRSYYEIAREEIFGPVLSIIGFEDEAEAVEIGNDVIYGLAAGVWTKDIGRAVRMSKALKAGTVWVNTYRAVSYMMPFGGVKHSGIGRESGIESRITSYNVCYTKLLRRQDGAPVREVGFGGHAEVPAPVGPPGPRKQLL